MDAVIDTFAAFAKAHRQATKKGADLRLKYSRDAEGFRKYISDCSALVDAATPSPTAPPTPPESADAVKVLNHLNGQWRPAVSTWSTPKVLDAILTLPSATPSDLALALGDEKQHIHLLCRMPVHQLRRHFADAPLTICQTLELLTQSVAPRRSTARPPPIGTQSIALPNTPAQEVLQRAKRITLSCACCKTTWPAQYLLHLLKLTEESKVEVPELQSLRVVITMALQDNAQHAFWRVCCNCGFDHRAVTLRETRLDLLRKAMARLGGGIGMQALATCMATEDSLVLGTIKFEELSIPATAGVLPLRVTTRPTTAAVVVINGGHVHLAEPTSPLMKVKAADVSELGHFHSFSKASVAQAIGHSSFECVHFLMLHSSAYKVLCEAVTRPIEIKMSCVTAPETKHILALLSKGAHVGTIYDDLTLNDEREMHIEQAWRHGFASSSGRVVDTSALTDGVALATRLFGDVSASGAFGHRSAGRNPRFESAHDLRFAKDAIYNSSPQTLILATSDNHIDYLAYSRGECAQGEAQPGTPALTALTSGISYQKQTESQGDSAATTPTSGPEFVDDLRQQVHLQIVVMAQLVAIGCLSYLGDHPSTCEFVDITDVVGWCPDAVCARAQSAMALGYNDVVNRAAMLTDAEYESGDALRILLDDGVIFEAYGLLHSTASHRDKHWAPEVITRHALPWVRSLSREQRSAMDSGATGGLSLVECALVLKATTQQRIIGGFQSLIHCGYIAPGTIAETAGCGGGTWKEVRSMGRPVASKTGLLNRSLETRVVEANGRVQRERQASVRLTHGGVFDFSSAERCRATAVLTEHEAIGFDDDSGGGDFGRGDGEGQDSVGVEAPLDGYWTHGGSRFSVHQHDVNSGSYRVTNHRDGTHSCDEWDAATGRWRNVVNRGPVTVRYGTSHYSG